MPFEDHLKTIKKNLSFLFISEVFTRLMMLVFTIILARVYGKEQFGVYALALSVGGLFEIFFNMGLNTVFIQNIVGEKKSLNGELATFLPLRIILSIVSYICFLVFIMLMKKDAATTESLALGGLYYTIASVVGFLWATFDAKKEMQYTAGIKLFQYIIIFGLGMYFIAYHYPMSSIIGAYVISMILAAVVTTIIIQKYFTKIQKNINPEKWWEIIKKGWPIALSGAFVFVYNYLDTIIISLNRGEEAVGMYQVSYKIIGTLFILSTLINQAYFPSLIETHHQDKHKLTTLFERALKTVFFWSIPITFGGIILAERIIPFIFGPEYQSASGVFKILIWNCLIYFASSSMTSLLYALGKQRQTLKVFFIGALVNTLLNIYIIPIYGIEGAAITTIAAEAAVLTGIYLMTRKILKVKITKNLWLPLTGGLLMIITLHYLTFESLILTVALGAAVYFAAYFALQKTITIFQTKKTLQKSL